MPDEIDEIDFWYRKILNSNRRFYNLARLGAPQTVLDREKRLIEELITHLMEVIEYPHNPENN